ncbi:SLBB domain-containing protein [Saprospiraceae bacterium]|nr:SLBB domain-containing protein [Saprospiraceae bacterium]
MNKAFLLRLHIICFIIVLSCFENSISAQTIGQDTLKEQIASLQNLVKKLQGFNENNKIYGHRLFKSDSIKILDATTITKIPENYILGIGDEISISIFGIAQLDGKYEVDKNGFINPDKISKIFLQGLTWSQAKEVIYKKFNNRYIFNRNQISMNVSSPRTVTINVFGNVNRPGTYSLPATNTAFNAIVAAGGPQANASVRNIKISDGLGQKTMDIYKLMDNPSKQFDFYLTDNAIIHVPLAKKVVHTEGALLRPMDYELTTQEGLTDLLDYAGGFKAQANKDLVQIKRFTNNAFVLIDIDMNRSSRENLNLINGDSIFVKTIKDILTNEIVVEGAVENTGAFSLTSTKKISDLVLKSKLKREAVKDVAYLYRKNEDNTYDIIEINLAKILNNPNSDSNLELQAQDKLVILDQSERVTNALVKVSGEVRRPTLEPFDPDSTLTVSRAIKIAGGLTDEATDFGFLLRSKKENPKEKTYIRINVKDAISNVNSDANLRLHAGDEIIVLKNADFTDQSYLYTKGAFRKEVKLFYDDNISVNDIVELSNGLGPDASGKIDVYRLVMDNNKASEVIVASIEYDSKQNIAISDSDFRFQPNDQIVARVKEDIDEQALINISGEVKYPGVYAMTQKNENLQTIITKAGGFTNQAFVEGLRVFRALPSDDEDTTTYYPVLINNSNLQSNNLNILLKSGDRVVVPKLDDVVEIHLKNTKLLELSPKNYKSSKIAVQHTPNKNAKWYIDNFAGGFIQKNDWKNLMVELPNGEVKKVSKRLLFFKKYPTVFKGSIIFIGDDELNIDTMDARIDYNANRDRNYNFPKSVKAVIINENGTNTKSQQNMKEDSTDSDKKPEQQNKG